MVAACEDEKTVVKPHRAPAQERELAPGHLIGDRYRIVAPLGRGGMGEVYSAEDLKLGQRVALKRLGSQFRPKARRALLYREIRAGRELAHPNLCRIHDLVEYGDDCFVSMEYVDGENLATLLRRIGRLPHRKSVEIARDLASALKAIHSRGLLHRDIKPSNIIIDGRGSVRVMDFGLAIAADDVAGNDGSGSPQYMAPEVLRGGASSVRSDLYSLGVTLYEIVTGRRAFRGSTVEEVLASHDRELDPPSHVCPNIDPDLERIILSCAERDPENRPRDAQAVLVGLGAAESVSSGEVSFLTVEAEAGLAGSDAGTATLVLMLAIVSLLGVAWLYGTAGLHHRLEASGSPATLAEKSRQTLGSLGYGKPSQSAYFWATSEVGGPWFVYRESSREVAAANEWGRWTLDDPNGPGVATIVLDADGRLRSLQASRTEATAARLTSSAGLFERANLDPSNWTEGVESHVPPVAHDERRAWSEARTGRRAEAAFLRGVPVYFDLFESTSIPTLERLTLIPEPDLGFPPLLYTIVVTAGVVLACVGARHNVVRGRGDRRGAFRLAMYLFATTFVAWLALANHVGDFVLEWKLLMRGIGVALLHAAVIWIVYLAVEPFMRRRWPHMTVAWARLLSGRPGDARVCRDTLVGITAGLVGRLILLLDEAPLWRGARLLPPHGSGLIGMGAEHEMLFVLLYYQFVAVFFSLGFVFLLVVLRRLATSDVVALVLLGAIVAPMGVSGTNVPVELTLSILRNGLLIAVLYRFGVHALAVAWLTYYVTLRVPLTLNPDAWFSGRSAVMLVLIAATAFVSYRGWVGSRSFVAKLFSEPHATR